MGRPNDEGQTNGSSGDNPLGSKKLIMKRNLLRLVGLIVLVPVLPFYAQSNAKKASVDQTTIPKDAVHIVLRRTEDAKQVFIYSPQMGIPEVPEPHDGLYRVEVNEKGKVAAVTILKGISPNADRFVMTQLVGWYAKPGPIRIVDVPVPYASTSKLLDPFTSMRTGLPPGHRENPKP